MGAVGRGKIITEKWFKKWILRGLKLRGSRQNQISIKRYTHWSIYRGKHPRIRAPPTQFQKLSQILKIEFSWNWTKTFISQESAWFIESFQIIGFDKFSWIKKLWRFLIPEFNLSIELNTTIMIIIMINSKRIISEYTEMFFRILVFSLENLFNKKSNQII